MKMYMHKFTYYNNNDIQNTALIYTRYTRTNFLLTDIQYRNFTPSLRLTCTTPFAQYLRYYGIVWRQPAVNRKFAIPRRTHM